MGDTIRITVVGLLPDSVNGKGIPEWVGEVAATEAPSTVRTIYRTTELKPQRQCCYLKISKLVDAGELKDGWHLTVTEHLRDLGCADVAWRVTKIVPGDTDSEDTTDSFPAELFQSSLEDAAEEILLSETPTEPFGSDAFWERFDHDAD